MLNMYSFYTFLNKSVIEPSNNSYGSALVKFKGENPDVISLRIRPSLMRTCYLKSSAHTTRLIDRILNINTVSLPVMTESYKTRFGDSIPYSGCSYLKLYGCLNLLKPSDEDVVFDIGCGMGRILCVFARRSVKKCIGIEISTELAMIARQNAKRLNGRKAPIKIVVADAAEADYSKGTIYCLFNPFGTRTLQATIERIHQSVTECPRLIRVVYLNAAFENVMESCGWLRCYIRRKSIFVKKWGTLSLWTNENSNKV